MLMVFMLYIQCSQSLIFVKFVDDESSISEAKILKKHEANISVIINSFIEGRIGTGKHLFEIARKDPQIVKMESKIKSKLGKLSNVFGNDKGKIIYKHNANFCKRKSCLNVSFSDSDNIQKYKVTCAPFQFKKCVKDFEMKF